jgi:MYXO-CTERM domain-containing protein
LAPAAFEKERYFLNIACFFLDIPRQSATPAIMKSKRAHLRKSAVITNSRWLAYATAGAATALAGSNSLEAAIHYSGPLHVPFPPGQDTGWLGFQLDQARDSFFLRHSEGFFSSARDYFRVGGIVSAAFRGYGVGDEYRASRLSLGDNISAGNFRSDSCCAPYLYPGPQWTGRIEGFIGFRFNNGAGIQYGWARIRMAGDPQKHAFHLVDYAYADPGEPITAGQYHNSSDEPAPDQSSLGWLALGAAGLAAWRKSRSLTLRVKEI